MTVGVMARLATVPAHVLQRLALGGSALAAVLVIGTAALGPSAAQPSLGSRAAGWRGVLPPYDLGLHPASWVVTVLVDVGYVVGGVAVALGLIATRRGARVPRAALLVAGCAAVLAVLVPPSGSGDHLNYAAYGRIEAQGGDPYVVAPAEWAGGRDPVTSAVEDPWTWAPSIYGPVATQLQAVASRFGGDDLRTTVWGWQLLCLLAWLAVGLVLHRVCSRAATGTATSRAAWLWLLNPVLLGLLLVGAHVDLLGAALTLTAVVLVARQPGLAGVALGGAIGIKVTFALVAPALLWALWRRRQRTGERAWPSVLAGVVGTAVPLVPFYDLAGRHALDQLLHARRYVSLATPWRPVVDWVTGPVSSDTVRDVVSVLAPVVLLLVLALVVVALRRTPIPRSHGPEVDSTVATVRDAALATVVLATAYLLAAPYSLPWYDAVAWAPLALVASGLLDVVLLVRLVTVGVAYVPGRVQGMSPRVEDLTLGYRTTVAPWIGWALLAGLAWFAVRSRPGAGQVSAAPTD